ncbi:Alkyl transferase [Mycena venus]|uniref:Alkyl transferase n=1 Tax=Mycena venus TaxID=2733690 RepID=A0A8H7CEJ8_9AGAR|nr:Alkyl transferase [Mycena venus]
MAVPISAPSSESHDGAASTTYRIFHPIESGWDIRDFILSLSVLLLASQLGLYFALPTYVAFLASRWCLLRLIRLRWPTFNRPDILDDLHFKPGACLSLAGSMTALLLQNHDPHISLAMKIHSDFYSRPLARMLRTFLYVELALNGTSEERGQTASWLRWTHKNIRGSVNPEMRKEFGLPDSIDHYGYTDPLKAYVMETLTWSTIAFQERFGRPLKRGVVLEYAWAGMRLGIPRSLLATNHEDFLVSFNRRLDHLDAGCMLNAMVINNIEASLVELRKKRWLTAIILRIALMVGFTLLPERVQSKYQLDVLKSRSARAVQRIICVLLWLVYPFLVWVPLRGIICLLVILEPQLRPVIRSSLQNIHCMDILSDRPKFVPDVSATPAYVTWLAGGQVPPPIMQKILVRTLEAQIKCTSWANTLRTWITYPFTIAAICGESTLNCLSQTVARARCQIAESNLFRFDADAKMPVHVGLVMDGNRRYARQLGQPVLAGHAKGAATASKVLEWWIRHLPPAVNHPSSGFPKYMTCWAFSSENFHRRAAERDGLFALMTDEFKSLAFTSLIHLFRIRVSFIGADRHKFPPELCQAMIFAEEATEKYDSLFLQIAVGYGGREEVVSAVRHLIAEGKEITEHNISEETYCQRRGVPPVNLIIRTSERRTSGFFLWDTQTAELHFVDKLWPQLTELDWLHAIESFTRREIRGGK